MKQRKPTYMGFDGAIDFAIGFFHFPWQLHDDHFPYISAYVVVVYFIFVELL